MYFNRITLVMHRRYSSIKKTSFFKRCSPFAGYCVESSQYHLLACVTHIHILYWFLSLNHNGLLLTTNYSFFLSFSLFHYVDYAHRHICIRFHRNGKICSKDRWCTISDVKPIGEWHGVAGEREGGQMEKRPWQANKLKAFKHPFKLIFIQTLLQAFLLPDQQ